MTNRWVLPLLAVAGLGLVVADADAGRRAVRVDSGGWTQHALGAEACPGSIHTSTLVQYAGLTFSGRNHPAFLAETYCQTSNPGEFDQFTFFQGDEPVLAAFVGDNDGDEVTAIRYVYLDGPPFEDPDGFQWAFYFFPDELTVVGLYGLVTHVFDDTSYITDGWVDYWNGATDGYDGEYFCVHHGIWIGSWDGTLEDTGSACLAALQRVFGDGFE